MCPDSYDSDSLIGFLKELKSHFRGQHVFLIWDNLPAHKSNKMKDFLEQQADWLDIERLPGYSPDLNPVEDLWGNIKGNELANQSAEKLGEVAEAVEAGMDRVRRQHDLLMGFLHHTGHFF